MDNAIAFTECSPAVPGEISRSGLDMRELRTLVRASERDLATLAGGSILITGATGWFGIWLMDSLCCADDLLRLGIRITAVSRNPDRFNQRFPRFAGDPRISWVTADVRDLEPMTPGFTHVIHAAADTSVGSDPLAQRRLFDTIVDGTRRTIAAAGASCRSFLFLSSGAIYGPQRRDRDRFEESAADDSGGPPPTDAYARGKRAAEQICTAAAAGGLPVRIARCFAFVGPHMPLDRHFAIGNFIADAVSGRDICIKSDGRSVRSYMYMTDLVHALVSILAKGEVDRPYNVGSDVMVTIEELARRVERVVGGRGVTIMGAPSDPNDRYVPDTTRLRTELGCLPQVSLEDAIAGTAAWCRAQNGGSMPS